MNMFTSRLRFVRPLWMAQNHFLEILITKFILRRHKDDRGVELELNFEQETPAIWSDGGKYDVQKMMVDFAGKAATYQKELDTFLLDGRGRVYEFNDPNFPFRYASGGTLPIVRMGEKEYYCLFYRDVYPVGWNIANGGCDNMEELLHPADTIERELREELIILDPRNQKRYSFEWDTGKRLDRSEFAVARKIWQERFKKLNVLDFQELGIPLKWLNGPDSVQISFGDEIETQYRTGDCFLNINAEDFGIEIDRIAKIHVDEDVVFCDGEISDRDIVDEMVGLFDVEKMNLQNFKKDVRFVPDFFFWGGKRYDKHEMVEILEKFLGQIASRRSEEEKEYFRKLKNRYNLCPVTRRIILRHLRQYESRAKKDIGADFYDTFISFAGEDKKYAEKLNRFLKTERQRRVFFSEESIHTYDYSCDIDEGLDTAENIVVVGTNPQHMIKPWVQFEWRSFLNDVLNQRKKGHPQIISFISFSEIELPRPLCMYSAVRFDPKDMRPGLEKLARYI